MKKPKIPKSKTGYRSEQKKFKLSNLEKDFFSRVKQAYNEKHPELGDSDFLIKMLEVINKKEKLGINQEITEHKNYVNYSSLKVMIGLSAGINSMAILCDLAKFPERLKPKELHLFYAHFEEHSNDSLPFVLDGVKFARRNFQKVVYHQTNNSVIDFFESQKMIPHPMTSPCTRKLKIEPINEYCRRHSIDVDLVGYVRNEKRRILNMANKSGIDADFATLYTDGVKQEHIEKHFPIANITDEECFSLVKSCIGWYPKIYDIKNEKGKRVFKHNNCLPCKNMTVQQLENVQEHYPEKLLPALKLSEKLQKYWGRNAQEFYTTFGKEDFETRDCVICSFD